MPAEAVGLGHPATVVPVRGSNLGQSERALGGEVEALALSVLYGSPSTGTSSLPAALGLFMSSVAAGRAELLVVVVPYHASGG